MKRKLLVSVSAILFIVGSGLWVISSGCMINTQITKPYVKRDLQVHEIKWQLKSKDFKERLEASQQIGKLEPTERLEALLVLSEEADPATRILAVNKLRELDDPRAKTRLSDLAANDPDPVVREMAGRG